MVLALTKEKMEMGIGIANLISYVLAGETLHEVSKLKRPLGRCPTSTEVKIFLGMNISKDEEGRSQE